MAQDLGAACCLFEATLTGDVLAGESRLGGIDVWRPDGSRPPPVHSSCRRGHG